MRHFLTLFSILCLLWVPTAAMAGEILFITPTRINLSDEKRVQEIRITNLSKLGLSYTLTPTDLIMDDKGLTQVVDTFDYSAKRMFRFVPRTFDLQPQETQIVRIMARFPANIEDGDYHSHIEFRENISKRPELNSPDGDSISAMQAHLSYAAGVPVTVTKGEVSVEVGARDARLITKENGKQFISLILERSGNGQGQANIDTLYQAPDGTTTFNAASRHKVQIYRERDWRPFEYLITPPEGQNLEPGGTLKISVRNPRKSDEEPPVVLTIPVE